MKLWIGAVLYHFYSKTVVLCFETQETKKRYSHSDQNIPTGTISFKMSTHYLIVGTDLSCYETHCWIDADLCVFLLIFGV